MADQQATTIPSAIQAEEQQLLSLLNLYKISSEMSIISINIFFKPLLKVPCKVHFHTEVNASIKSIQHIQNPLKSATEPPNPYAD